MILVEGATSTNSLDYSSSLCFLDKYIIIYLINIHIHEIIISMMTNRKKLEQQLRALANGRRLQILSELHRRKRADVTTLASLLQISQEGVSQHLAVLFAVGIVERRKRGLHVFYRLSLPQEQLVRKVLDLL